MRREVKQQRIQTALCSGLYETEPPDYVGGRIIFVTMSPFPIDFISVKIENPALSRNLKNRSVGPYYVTSECVKCRAVEQLRRTGVNCECLLSIRLTIVRFVTWRTCNLTISVACTFTRRYYCNRILIASSQDAGQFQRPSSQWNINNIQ